MKSESLNILVPSGPVQVCNGIALPLLSSELSGAILNQLQSTENF